jgi:hypothetical protein
MEREQEETDTEKIRQTREESVEALIKYLETYHPPGTMSDSKHALMGPVGKFLTKITTTGEINWGAVKGYVLSIHKNQQSPRGVSAKAAERLDEAAAKLTDLRALLPPTKWLKTVEDLDDEIFFGVYKGKLVGQRKGIQRKFQEWLKEKYSSIDSINEYLIEAPEYESFDHIEDPFSTPSELQEVVKEFWDDYKQKKGEK